MKYYKYDNEDEIYYFVFSDKNIIIEHMYMTGSYFEYNKKWTRSKFDFDGMEEITKNEYDSMKLEKIKILTEL